MSIKRKLYFVIDNSIFRFMMPFFEKLNNILFHWDQRERIVHLGSEDEDKTYYVIRARSKEEGLMSLYFNNTISQIVYAKKRGYIPVVDYCNKSCQYWSENNASNNIDNNAWEYYFEQPDDISVSDILKKKNVIYSGWTFFGDNKKCFNFDGFINGDDDSIKLFANKYGKINKNILRKLNLMCENFGVCYNTMGVFLRGTDYVALKPKGHFRQPSVDTVCLKIDEFLTRNEINKILLVTEDYNIFIYLKNRYGDRVFSPDDVFIRKYEGNFLEKSFNDDPYARGERYIMRLLLLTKCGYLISSLTNGSIFVLAHKQGLYKDKYIFNIGKY